MLAITEQRGHRSLPLGHLSQKIIRGGGLAPLGVSGHLLDDTDVFGKETLVSWLYDLGDIHGHVFILQHTVIILDREFLVNLVCDAI